MQEQLAALAKRIDHTILKADATREQVLEACQACKIYGFGMIAINSAQVALCRHALAGSGVHVGAAISFPLGQTPLAVKRYETAEALGEGADEIDYVANITDVKDGRWEKVQEEMQALTELCHQRGALIKVIFENCYLTQEQIRRMAEIARRVGPDFIKTSTGFGTGGARVEDVRLMKEAAGPRVAVKAAGGIRNLDTLLAMEQAGATRFGTSAGVAIMEEAKARLAGGGTR